MKIRKINNNNDDDDEDEDVCKRKKEMEKWGINHSQMADGKHPLNRTRKMSSSDGDSSQSVHAKSVTIACIPSLHCIRKRYRIMYGIIWDAEVDESRQPVGR